MLKLVLFIACFACTHAWAQSSRSPVSYNSSSRQTFVARCCCCSPKNLSVCLVYLMDAIDTSDGQYRISYLSSQPRTLHRHSVGDFTEVLLQSSKERSGSEPNSKVSRQRRWQNTTKKLFNRPGAFRHQVPMTKRRHITSFFLCP